MKKERRSYRRLYPHRPVQLIFDCGKEVIGRVHNISNQGVAVEYDGALISCRDRKEVSARIAIDQQSRLKVDSICCTPVYDISTLAHDQSFRGVHMRLCGLKFLGISRTQHEQLDRLIARI